MARLPIVSIVGRPNVGKSSLFNRILHRRIAVVNDTPGVTRDRNYMETSWNGIDFCIVDTGGLLPTSRESIPQEINRQVDTALAESSAIIFLIDAQAGPTDLDLLIAQRLRKTCYNKVILAGNKAESSSLDYEAYQLTSLGCGDPLLISALHGKGVGDLLDDVCATLKENQSDTMPFHEEVDLSLAVIGRPNAGKSSFVNKVLQDDRMIVDNVPGTTRDAIDSIVMYNKKKVRIIDTAGLRRKAQVNDDIEYYSNLRALGSVKRANVCVLLIDTDRKVGEQDLKIIAHINKQRKGIIICWNKWDLVEKDHKTFDTLVAETKKTYMELQYVPMISISALTGQRVPQVLDTAFGVLERMEKRIKPAQLRENLFTWTRQHPHPYISSKQVRFLGIKQQKIEYPQFNLFCSNPEMITPAYQRFLRNKIQAEYDFSGCPVILTFKPAGVPGQHKEETDDSSSEKEL